MDDEVSTKSMGQRTLEQWRKMANIKEDGKSKIVAVSAVRYELIGHDGNTYGRYDVFNKRERWISTWWPHVNQ